MGLGPYLNSKLYFLTPSDIQKHIQFTYNTKIIQQIKIKKSPQPFIIANLDQTIHQRTIHPNSPPECQVRVAQVSISQVFSINFFGRIVLPPLPICSKSLNTHLDLVLRQAGFLSDGSEFEMSVHAVTLEGHLRRSNIFRLFFQILLIAYILWK